MKAQPLKGWCVRRRVRVLLAVCAGLAAVVATQSLATASTSAPPLHQTGGARNSDPILFVLCNWGSDWNYRPNDLGYYQDLWTDGTAGGYHSLADYYRQISFGQTDIAGSAVLDGAHSDNGWYSMIGGTSPTSLSSYALDGGGGSATRVNKAFSCLDAASADLTAAVAGKYQSIIAVTPNANTTVTAPIAAGQTSIQVASASILPTAPFYVILNSGQTEVKVTAVDTATNTLTVTPSPVAVASGVPVTTDTSDDFGSRGRRPSTTTTASSATTPEVRRCPSALPTSPPAMRPTAPSPRASATPPTKAATPSATRTAGRCRGPPRSTTTAGTR